jgi:predicted nucleotidyltransferase
MNRDDAVSILKSHRPELALFGVKSLAIFGSVARDEAGAQSDVDVLVEFDGPATFDRYMDLKFALEELLHCEVDLVTRKALRPEMVQQIDAEAIRVA